jgi:hypothetical protein
MKSPSLIIVVLFTSVLVSSSTCAWASLINRGGGMIYDTDLNITWLANANLADTNSFGIMAWDTAQRAGIHTSGAMPWNTAQDWIGAMNTANYLGLNIGGYQLRH